MNDYERLTLRAKRVMELSLREALQLGCNYVGTEHILLGLIREGEGVAAKVLTGRLELSLKQVRQAVIQELTEYRAPSPHPLQPQVDALAEQVDALRRAIAGSA